MRSLKMSLNHGASAKVFLVGQMLMVMMVIASAAKPLPGKKKAFLDAHNAIRAEVGVGPMTWNKTLENYAQKYANSRLSKNCEFEHSGGPYGENLAEGYGEMTGDAVRYWATEKRKYDYASNSCAQNDICGHYTQVVWRNSVRLGCATVNCGKGLVFAICNYDPPGNYMGERPY